MVRIVATSIFFVVLVTTAFAFTQPAPDPERRAGITIMRVINTAEHAVKARTAKFVDLNELINHSMMGGVRAEITTNGSDVFYQGRQLRLLLSPDGLRYQAMVVPADSCGTAIFSDERGLIYTGKVLDC